VIHKSMSLKYPHEFGFRSVFGSTVSFRAGRFRVSGFGYPVSGFGVTGVPRSQETAPPLGPPQGPRRIPTAGS